MRNLMTRFMKDESGATAIEYGLLAALIAAVIIGTISLIGQDLLREFKVIQTELAG